MLFLDVDVDIEQIFIYRGIRIGEAKMSIETTGKITASFGLVGTDFKSTTINPVTSYVYHHQRVLKSIFHLHVYLNSLLFYAHLSTIAYSAIQ